VDSLQIQSVRAEGPHAAAVIDRLREGVSRENRQAVRIAARDLDGERMVIGRATVDHVLDQTELGKWPALRERRRSDNGQVRQVAEALEPVTLAAEVTRFEASSP